MADTTPMKHDDSGYAEAPPAQQQQPMQQEPPEQEQQEGAGLSAAGEQEYQRIIQNNEQNQAVQDEMFERLEAQRQQFHAAIDEAFAAAKQNIQYQGEMHSGMLQEVLNQVVHADEVQNHNDHLAAKVRELAANF